MAGDDVSAIVNVTNLYAVAVDSRRYRLFEQIFTPDVHLDFGAGPPLTDRATLIAAYADIHAVFAATQHMTSGHVVTIEGDSARCFSYVHARFRRVLGAGAGEGLFDSTGWYDDRLRRTSEGWRIANRASRMVSWTGDKRVMEVMPGVDTDYVLASLWAEADGGGIRFLAQA